MEDVKYSFNLFATGSVISAFSAVAAWCAYSHWQQPASQPSPLSSLPASPTHLCAWQRWPPAHPAAASSRYKCPGIAILWLHSSLQWKVASPSLYWHFPVVRLHSHLLRILIISLLLPNLHSRMLSAEPCCGCATVFVSDLHPSLLVF